MNSRIRIPLFFACVLVLFTAAAVRAAGEMNVYFGTYTRANKSRGIYVSKLNLQHGTLSAPELAGETTNPSFLALHPNGRFLYAVGENSTFNGKKTGAVTAFAIDPATGRLKQLNQQSSGGTGPCHLVVDPTGRALLVANYGGGSVASLPVEANGTLDTPAAFHQHTGSSVNPTRQKEPHAHSINLDPAGRFAFAPDLGLDRILAYQLELPSARILPHSPKSAAVAPGSGPRHFAFSPDARHAYVINEILSTVTAFAYDARAGVLKEIQTLSSLPAGHTGNNSTAHIEVHPSGKFVYGSNRGHDSIVVFARNEQTGRLTLVEHESTQGKVPRNFGIDPTGRWLLAANQNSDSVVVFAIDPQTGALTPNGQKIEVHAPVCVKFLPAR